MNKNYNKPELEVEAFEIESDFAADSNVTVPVEPGLGGLSSGLEFEVDFNGNDEI